MCHLCYTRSKADITLGKSVLLRILLVLRLQAKLPTIFQCDPHLAYYFTATGVWSIDRGDIKAAKKSTPQVWALIDSSKQLTTVDEVYYNSSIFIVQTPSPREFRIDWWKKAGNRIEFFILEPWSLSELLSG